MNKPFFSDLPLSLTTLQTLQSLSKAKRASDLVAQENGVSLRSRFVSVLLSFFRTLLRQSKITSDVAEALEMAFKDLADCISTMTSTQKDQLYMKGANDFLEKVCSLLANRKGATTDPFKFNNLLKELKNSLSQSQWLNETLPESSTKLLQAIDTLKLSEDPSIPLNERMKLFPKLSWNADFVSFVRKAPFEGNGSQPEIAFVMKCANEKLDSIITPNYEQPTKRIQRVIRERLAYSLQKSLQLPCGCPPTAIVQLKSHLLTKVHQELVCLSSNARIEFTLEDFPHFLHDINSFAKFLNTEVETLDKKLQEKFSSLYPEIKAFLNQEKTLPSSLNVFGNASSELKQSLRNVKCTDRLLLDMTSFQMLNLSLNRSAILQHARELYESLKITSPPTQKGLVSCQETVPNTQCLSKLSVGERGKISPKEFEKFTLDLLLLNNDRHLKNVLISKKTFDILQKELISSGIPEKALEEDLSTLSYGKSLTALLAETVEAFETRGLTISLTMEQTLANLIFLKTKNEKYCYCLTLIDHELCLPDLSKNRAKMIAKHHWSNYPQANTPISGKTKSHILKLNYQNVIDNVKMDIAKHVERFGAACQISLSSLDLLHMNFIYLQKGVELDIPLKWLDLFFQEKHLASLSGDAQPTPLGGEIEQIYAIIETYRDQNKSVDWDRVTSSIESVLHSYKEQLAEL